MMASGIGRASRRQRARAVKRIDDVVTLRAAQFPEDAGPMAHPIRPESYPEIGNFYTATVYEKGAGGYPDAAQPVGRGGIPRRHGRVFPPS